MYFLRELPDIKTHLDLFYKYKRTDEHLGLADIKRQDISFVDTSTLEHEIKSFFNEGRLMKEDQFEWGRLRTPTENYIKCVYLAHDYTKNNGFDNPVGAHYNPRIEKFQIHPGRDRGKILDLMNADTIECVAFNTGGHPLEFKKRFDTAEQLREHFINQPLFFSVTADHGSIIPHTFIDWMTEDMTVIDELVPKRMKQTFAHLKEFWNSHRVTHNFERFTNRPIAWHQGDRPIHIKAYSYKGMLKGWVLAPYIKEPYQDKDVRIQTF